MVSEAIFKCLPLIETCYGKDSVLYGYNTDGIYISNSHKSFQNKRDVEFSTKKIGNAYVTDSTLSYYKNYRENMDISNYKTKNGIGRIYTGQAGSGKTTKLYNMVKDAKNPFVIIYE